MLGFFKDSITRKVETQNKYQKQIEVLKKQQKVSGDAVLKDFAMRRAELANSVDAEIAALKAQIVSLQDHKKTQGELLNEQQKVTLDKVINGYDAKILSVQNKFTKITHLIEAEEKNMQDVIKPKPINAPQASVKIEAEVNSNQKKSATKKTSK